MFGGILIVVYHKSNNLGELKYNTNNLQSQTIQFKKMLLKISPTMLLRRVILGPKNGEIMAHVAWNTSY